MWPTHNFLVFQKVIPQGQNLKLLLNQKASTFYLIPTIFLSSTKQAILFKTKQERVIKGISTGYSSLEVHFAPKKGVGFQDIKIQGEKVILTSYTPHS